MKREVDINEISDGGKYTSGDYVLGDVHDCQGCHACCCGMGESIILDPMDAYRLSKGMQAPFSEILSESLELHVVDGLILPNIRMQGDRNCCIYLNIEGRCSIHEYRPGICRLFPLGRIYENGSFHYFLQTQECTHEKTRIKIAKMLDTPHLRTYEQYVSKWHYFMLHVQDKMERAEESFRKQVCLYILQLFFMKPYDTETDFYEQFEARLLSAKDTLEV